MRPTQKKTIINKGIALAVIAAAVLGGQKLVAYYWYILDSYCYTCEFYMLFVANNLKSANLDMFKECLLCMNPVGTAFPMVVYSHLVQNFWLPFTKQILPVAATSSYGVGLGSLFTYLSFVIVGLVSYGLGVFFFGDIVPFLQARAKKDYARSTTRLLAIPLTVLLAVPYVPIPVSGIAAGTCRMPWKKAVVLMLLGPAVRAGWLISFPEMFT